MSTFWNILRWYIKNNILTLTTPAGHIATAYYEPLSALHNLQNNKNLIVKPADKGGAAIVMWSRDDYIREISKQLGNSTHYKHIPVNPHS